jgi:hypothetical protein
MDRNLLEALQATAEIYGRQLTETAASFLLADLGRFSSQEIMKALSRCRQELKFFPTVADIIARIDDGRPGPEEAWAMVPKDESGSVVWTDEMSGAFSVARTLIDSDPIAARQAFKESYTRLVAEARAQGIPARWSPSLGFEKHSRDAALIEAVNKRRMSIEHAMEINPALPLAAPKGPRALPEPPPNGGPPFNVSNLLRSMPK